MIDATRIADRLRRLGNFLRLESGVELPEGAILGATETGETVTLQPPDNQRACHEAVFAGSGSGKTICMQSVRVQEHVQSYLNDAPDKRMCQFIVDSAKGDFAEGFLHGLAAEAPELLPNVHWLHSFSAGAYALNLNKLALGETPLDIRALQLAHLVADVSTGVGAQAHLGAGSRQIDAIEHLFLGALSSPHPNANILWALDALEIPSGMKRLASIATHARARSFLEYTRLSPELTASVKSRIRTALASTDKLERIVSAGNCIQFGPMTEPGQIVIFTVHEPPGGMVQLSRLYANMFCRLAFTHLLDRTSPWEGPHLRITIDEAQVVAGVLSDLVEHLETTGRSKGLSVSIITQGTALLRDASETLFKVLLTNTPTKIVGRLNASDAELFAREQAPRKGSDETFSRFRQKLVGAITTLEDRQFFKFTPGERVRFRSLDVDLDAWSEAAEVHKDAIDAVKNRYALPQDTERRVTLADVTEPPKRKRKRTATKAKTTASQRTKAKPESKPSATNKKPRSKWG